MYVNTHVYPSEVGSYTITYWTLEIFQTCDVQKIIEISILRWICMCISMMCSPSGALPPTPHAFGGTGFFVYLPRHQISKPNEGISKTLSFRALDWAGVKPPQAVLERGSSLFKRSSSGVKPPRGIAPRGIACHVIIPQKFGDVLSRTADFFSEMYNEKIF